MRISTILAAALATGLTTAQDLATVLGGDESLSSLVELLGQVPDTTEFIASQDQVTLFAPSNEAISALESAPGPDLLAQILRYHLYSGVVRSTDISEVPLFPESYLSANLSGGQVASVSLDQDGNAIVTSGLKAVSTVTQADIEFDNGIIHIIDAVLTIPPSASDTLLEGRLTALAGAASQADLIGALDGSSDITVFAPNNAAFQAIAGAIPSLSTGQLISILQYHVIPGTAVYSTLLGNTSVPTLQGTFVDIAISPEGAVFVDGARVINSDILIDNGVLHVIDAVLNPEKQDPQPGTPGLPTGGDSGSVPFTSGVEGAATPLPALAGTTSFVAEVLVTAAPEPSIILLPNLSLSTIGGGTAIATSATDTPVAESTGSPSTAVPPTETAVAGGASASETMMTSASAPVSGSASAADSAVPEQQTGNTGARKEAAAVAALGALAFAAVI